MTFENIKGMILLGLENSLQPCAMFHLLVFLVIITSLKSHRNIVNFFGSFYVAGNVIGAYLGSLGFFDPFLTHEGFATFLKNFYLVCALICVWTGLLNFIDWVLLKQKKEVKDNVIRLPQIIRLLLKPYIALLTLGKNTKVVSFIISGFLGLVLGFVANFFAAIQSNDYGSYLLFLSLLDQQKIFGAFFSIVIYSIASSLLILFTWSLYLKRLKKENLEKSKQGISNSMLKISFSALFIATGVGLAFVFLN